MFTKYRVGDLVELKCNNNKDVMNGVIIEEHSTREQVFRVVVVHNGVFSEPIWRHTLDFARKVA